MAHRDDSEWLTLGQAARVLGVAQSTIRKWSDQGRVPAFYTPGGHRRYRRADLETFVERSGPAGKPKEGPLIQLVRVTLEFEGYIVREAASADEGLAAIADAKPDLILLDVMMPHVDGWEMLRRVQERYGAGTIPVVMFSGQADEETQALAASSGAQGFVGKPFDLQHLVAQTKQTLPI
jgi:excisionase family DNA binding protein